LDLLAWVQNEIQPRTFPVVVLSGSDRPEDKANALALGADAYWPKPSRMRGFKISATAFTASAISFLNSAVLIGDLQ
jgi:CheY-like chemotaxis protein